MSTTDLERSAPVVAAFRRKALACLREGRVTVMLAQESGNAHGRPVEIIAAVRSSREGGPTYAVDRNPATGVWACTCRAGHPCAHSLAVALVTGWGPTS